MAPKLLIAGLTLDDKCYVDRLLAESYDVRVLDCLDEVHSKVQSWYGDRCIFVSANRPAVLSAVRHHRFEVSIVRESPTDFVRTALLTQTLRDAGVRKVIVITRDASRTTLYRRCGAHQVIVAESADDGWEQAVSSVSKRVFAS